MYRTWSSCDDACPSFCLLPSLEAWHAWCRKGDKPQSCEAFSCGLNANLTICSCPNTTHRLDLHNTANVIIYNIIQWRCFALTNFFILQWRHGVSYPNKQLLPNDHAIAFWVELDFHYEAILSPQCNLKYEKVAFVDISHYFWHSSCVGFESL